WKVKAGGGTFKFKKADAMVLLTTITGHDVCVSIVTTTSTEEYMSQVQSFMESIELSTPTWNTTGSTVSQPTGNETAAPVNAGNYTFSTTNFNDGWTSSIKNDWVEVTKEDMKVYLWYALPLDAIKIDGVVMKRDYFWDNYITKYFDAITKHDGEYIGSLKPDYVEGWATDKQTGEKRFIAMYLSWNHTATYITIASMKDEAALRQQFPKANGKYISDLANMAGYNKFAVDPNDVVGTWQDGKSANMQWYYVNADGGYGGNAGMTIASTATTFVFEANGTYENENKGATGVVGNLSTFQQHYKGEYTVTEWSITATKQWEGKAKKFNASFMAVRGGRILRLQDGGLDYSLVKVK
ncbi:MAG TPA: hypothetical protein PLR74_00585, partial [Agriterribacter sp.]|nr:hypothetical protein [Agriterribacter sp.]